MAHAPQPAGAGRRRSVGIRWPFVVALALVELVISVPTMAVEEDWHGHPMIDERTFLWVAAGCLVAAAFLGGGVFTGYRLPSAAAKHAVMAAAVAITVLLAGALARRLLWGHTGIPGTVVVLWCIGSAVSLLLSALGSQLGRYLPPASR